MPTLSRIAVRSALTHFLVGTTLGALLLVHKAGLFVLPNFATLLVMHFHVMVAGWLVQLAVGVALWILPRMSRKAQSAGHSYAAMAGITSLNLGVVSSLFSQHPPPCFYLASSILIAFDLWPRIRPFGTTIKEST
ncbi:MAG: hypothetical protein R3E66_22810 [bacterium]